MKPFRFSLVITVLVAGAGCADAGTADVTDRSNSAVFDSSGLATWELSERPAAILRDDEAGPRFFDGVALAWQVNDTVIGVVDAGSCEVRTYSAAGRLMHTHGRRGSGPGECRTISGAWRLRDGRVAIADGRLGRVSLFDANRGYVGSMPIGLSPAGGGWVLEGIGRAHLLMRVYGLPSEQEHPTGSAFTDSTDLWSIPIPGTWPDGSLDTTSAAYLGRFPDSEKYALITRGIWHYTDVPLAPQAYLATGDSFVVYAAGGDFDVMILPLRGGPGRRVSVDVSRVRLAQQDFDSRLESDVEARAGRPVADGFRPREPALREHFQRVYDLIPLPESAPAIADIAIDASNRIWIRRWGRASDTEATWWVLQQDGTPIATIRIPADVAELWADTSRIVAVRRDTDGVESVTVWEYQPMVM